MKSSVLSLVGALLLATPALAQVAGSSVALTNPSSFLGPRAQGRDGNTVASPLDHDSLFQNPASAAFTSQYALTAGYLGFGDSLAASVVDTKSGPVGGGLSYVRSDFRSESNLTPGQYARTEERAGLGLMGKLQPDFAVGVNVKYAYRRSYDPRVTSNSNFNFDVGAQYQIRELFAIGLVGQNLMTDTTGISSRILTLGIESLVTTGLLLSAQISRYFVPDFTGTPYLFGVGAQYFITQKIAARAGYSDNQSIPQQSFAVGLGYRAAGFSIDYAFQHAISGQDMNLHSIALTGYF